MTTNYTADYTQHANGLWSAALRHDDTPDTVIETGRHADVLACVCEVYDLAGPGVSVKCGDVRTVSGVSSCP